MKKLFLPFISILLLSILFPIHLLHAQDTLYKENGSRLVVTIIEIAETQVKYRVANDTANTTYVIHKNEVKKIVHENGMTDLFPKDAFYKKGAVKKADPRQTDFGRHFFSLTATDLIAPCLTLNYEYIFKSGYFGLRVPLSFALSNTQENYFFRFSDEMNSGEHGRKIFSSGIDFNIYPAGQGTVSYYWGPVFEWGQFDYYSYASYVSSTSENYNKGNFYALLLQNGLLFQLSRHLNISTFGAAGCSMVYIKYHHPNYTNHTYKYTQIGFALRWGIGVGYKF